MTKTKLGDSPDHHLTVHPPLCSYCPYRLFNTREFRVAHPSLVIHLVLLYSTDIISEHQESSKKTKKGRAAKGKGAICLGAPEALEYSLRWLAFPCQTHGSAPSPEAESEASLPPHGENRMGSLKRMNWLTQVVVISILHWFINVIVKL